MNLDPHLTDETAQLLADGALEHSSLERVELHVARCAECAAVVESYRALAASLEVGLEASPPPASFTAGVMERIAAAEGARSFERRLAFGILGGAAAAALVLFTLAGASAWAPALSRSGALLAGTLEALRLGGDVLTPIVHVLRLQIAVVAALAVLLLSALLRPLVPARAHARAA